VQCYLAAVGAHPAAAVAAVAMMMMMMMTVAAQLELFCSSPQSSVPRLQCHHR
jgi:hypothetical protein